MTENLSVENIKKDIINKLISSKVIMECLDVESCTDEEYNHMDIGSPIRKCIFCNDIFKMHNRKENYISVDVEEHEQRNGVIYYVVLKIKIEGEDKISKISSGVKDIISELYPDRMEYSNVPFKPISEDYGYETYHRMITCKIKKENKK